MTARTILFVSKGEDASSTRYRALQFFPLLEAHGWRPIHLTDHRSLASRRRILAAAHNAEVVVVLRRCFTNPFRFVLRKAAKRLFFDFDDAIFLRSSGERSRIKETRFRRMTQICDQIWAGNDYLSRFVGRWNSHVEVIPTALDPRKYEITATKPSSSIDLVWIGSSATRKHLVSQLPALERTATQRADLRLKIIADFDLKSPNITTLPIQWSAATEARELASAHIGIAPLPDNPFTRGKCGLKTLQYMAAGLPVIASPTGVNADIVQPGATGFLARSEDDWMRSVSELAAKPELRYRMGQAGRKHCRAGYSINAVFETMLETLES